VIARAILQERVGLDERLFRHDVIMLSHLKTIQDAKLDSPRLLAQAPLA
jgi:hypothetical protein